MRRDVNTFVFAAIKFFARFVRGRVTQTLARARSSRTTRRASRFDRRARGVSRCAFARAR
jgi:hypothetical protein